MAAIITAERLTKVYRLGTIGRGTLQKDFARWWAGVRRRPDPTVKIGQERHARQVGETFWALDDVNFEVAEGAVLGIIGRNGAGKSTLLKILSQVTAPTSGVVTLRGRVASLLEVGTGFHPELTGRENVFLNGAILGMTKAEIRAKFDEIVAFSECGPFIDTPVRRYSSGMYVRLAFAVAAHLEPEILIVDEVLAVGDAQFQKKCLGKMQDVARLGRTVLFVSHSMSAVTRLCTSAMLLNGGRIQRTGPVQDVVADYLHSGRGTPAERTWVDRSRAPGDDTVRLRGVRVLSDAGVLAATVDIRRPIGLEIDYEVLVAGSVMMPGVHLFNGDGTCVFVSFDWNEDWRRQPRPVGRFRSRCLVPANFLAEGTHVVGVAVNSYAPFIRRVWAPDAVAFEVVDGADGDSARGDFAGVMPGVVRPVLPWTTTRDPH